MGNNCAGAIAPFNRCSLNLSVFCLSVLECCAWALPVNGVLRDTVENVLRILINMEKLHHKLSIGKGEKKFESDGSFLLDLRRATVSDWKLLCKEILQLVPPVR